MRGSIKFAISLWITLCVYLAVNWTECKSVNNFFLIIHLTCTFAGLLIDCIEYQTKNLCIIGKYNPINIMLVMIKKTINFLDKTLD